MQHLWFTKLKGNRVRGGLCKEPFYFSCRESFGWIHTWIKVRITSAKVHNYSRGVYNYPYEWQISLLFITCNHIFWSQCGLQRQSGAIYVKILNALDQPLTFTSAGLNWCLPAGFQHTAKDLVMLPYVPTLCQCKPATRQNLLHIWVWHVFELVVFLWATPKMKGEGAGKHVICSPGQEAKLFWGASVILTHAFPLLINATEEDQLPSWCWLKTLKFWWFSLISKMKRSFLLYGVGSSLQNWSQS